MWPSGVAALELDLGYVTLVLGSLLQKVNEQGVVTREEVKAPMARSTSWTASSGGAWV
jgi:hypothetical protein